MRPRSAREIWSLLGMALLLAAFFLGMKLLGVVGKMWENRMGLEQIARGE